MSYLGRTDEEQRSVIGEQEQEIKRLTAQVEQQQATIKELQLTVAGIPAVVKRIESQQQAPLRTIAAMKACRKVPTEGAMRQLHLYACPYCVAKAALAAEGA